MTPEDRKAMRQRMKNIPKEQREKFRQRVEQMSPEERKEFRRQWKQKSLQERERFIRNREYNGGTSGDGGRVQQNRSPRQDSGGQTDSRSR